MDHQHPVIFTSCKHPGCYRSLGIPLTVGSFGLALYSILNENHQFEYSEFGRMIHDLKYRDSTEIQDRDKQVNKLADTIGHFINGIAKIRPIDLPFQLIVTPPRNSTAKQSLPSELATLLIAKSYAEEHVAPSKVGEVTSMKNVAPDNRSSQLAGKFTLEMRSGVERVLILDDVYETGSTVNEVVRCCRAAFGSEVSIMVVAVTYLRDDRSDQ